MSSFCAVGGVWDVFTNTHHSELAAQNDLFQKRRSGLAPRDELNLAGYQIILNAAYHHVLI
jgi:hypothetical protein